MTSFLAMMRKTTFASLLVAAMANLLAVPTQAQKPRQVLHNHVRPAVTNGRALPLALLPLNQHMNLAITLPLRNQAELTSLLDRLYDPSNSDYRHFLSVAQFTEQFGPTVEDYQAVVNFAKANGLAVTHTSPNRLLVDVSGTVAQVNSAFHVVMTVYHHPTENRTFYSPDREPSLDLNVPVAHIAGMNNFSVPHPMAKTGRAKLLLQESGIGSGPNGFFLGSDMRAAYYGGSLLNGAGQAIGLVEFSGYSLSDVQLYFANAGQSLNVPINNVASDGANPYTWTDALSEGEVVLDIVQAISMAPSLAQVRVYVGFAAADIFNQMATEDAENLAKQLSCSWSWYPDDPATDDPWFQEFAAQGQSIFIASGDNGAYTGSDSNDASYPAEDIYVTAVGGTELTTKSAGGPWQSETAWNQLADGDGASGGGPSDDGFPIPIWQAAVINSSNGGSATVRNIPDVAAEAADDNYNCYNGGSCKEPWYGTSFATPRWAGFMALVNQQAASAGLSSVGFLNPTIYSIGQGANYNDDFHDILPPGNNNNGIGQSYNAVTGYDLVTGWGSPHGQSLINDLSTAVRITSTTTIVRSSSNPSADGQIVTLTAAVQSTSGMPTGTVTFYNGTTQMGIVSLVNGQGSLQYTFSGNGNYSITALYAGDANDIGSTSPILIQYVMTLPIATSTTLATSASPTDVGQSVTFTAMVSWNHGAPPNGELITFKDITNNVVLGSAPLSGGVAILTTSSLAQGSHTIKAKYPGEATFLGSNATVTQYVQRDPTTTSLGSSLNPAALGQSVILTAQVTTTGPDTPTGTVTFYKGTQVLGTVTLNSNGAARWTTTTLPPGTHPMTAVYNRDAYNGTSTSPVLEQTID